MKFYPNVALAQWLSAEKLIENGTWSLYCDVTCEDCCDVTCEDCGKVHSWAAVGGPGGKCQKCCGRCL